MNLVRGGIRA